MIKRFGERPIAVDLFAGVGGFSLGIEQAGFDVAVAVEKDPIHAAVYSYNKPNTNVLCADATKVSGEDILKALRDWDKSHGCNFQNNPNIALVFGGPPCQGFSAIGKRNVDDKRNNLVFEFWRLVKELQPDYFIMENVPGLLSHRYSNLVQKLLDDFKDAGYQIAEPVQILDASDFGVPQKRRRVFILGNRTEMEPLCYPPVPILSQKRRVTVEDAIADLPNLDDFEELLHRDWVQLSRAQLYQMQTRASDYAKRLRNLIPDEDNFAYPRWWNPQLLTSSMRTEHESSSKLRFKTVAPGKMEQISRLKRLHWEHQCYTLRAGTDAQRGAHTSARPLHPEHPRVISVREAARLHSFPDWYRFHVTKWHGFREVGNAVPPILARALGKQVITAISHTPSVPETTLSLKTPNLLEFNTKKAFMYWFNHSS
ncbi:MAG TPA: DNA (cytosine-5-)-methyltransferase [Cyanobacteria bacterium UBA8553]|nr:DNA (cytosine-5-)-methyltransferase [Cyanobacteria bacterium UBA8553]HAJ61001.1 DNA (cytosine-5-)-methyltransferase [Cyanobacteria bacterium UBA8543]